ncbi:MAG: hypothetical protein A2V79_05905 [Betaproteobacteria bacterium RBG_16_56_24]|nr:MAG: hypothetical protein A2V79_05905 [Betaproteobacteria bacterium RBG_16_56_24]
MIAYSNLLYFLICNNFNTNRKDRECIGIENFRWHDLRHTWASWHIQEGTPQHVLQELGGWSTPEMVQKYAHLSADHLAPYADRLCALRVVDVPENGTFMAQSQK